MKYRKTGDNNGIKSKSDLYWKSHFWGQRFYYDAPLPFGTAAVLANETTCIVATSLETTKEMDWLDDDFIHATYAGAAIEPVEKAIVLPCARGGKKDLAPVVALIPKLRKELNKLSRERIKEDKEDGGLSPYRWAREKRTPMRPWLKSLVGTVEEAALSGEVTEFKIVRSDYFGSISLVVPMLETAAPFTLGDYHRSTGVLRSYSPRLSSKLKHVVKASGGEVNQTLEYDRTGGETHIFDWDIFGHLLNEKRRAARTLPEGVSSGLPGEIKDMIARSWNAFNRLSLPLAVTRYLDSVGDSTEPTGCCLCSGNSTSLTFCNECSAEVNHGLPIRGNVNWDRGMRWGLDQLVLEFGGAMSQRQTWLHSIAEASPQEGLRAYSRMLALQGDLTWSKRLSRIIDGYRPSWGTYSIATDGHFCRSIFERVIDDFMTQHGIAHTPEPSYPKDDQLNPNGLLRADWKLEDGTLVEAFGALEKEDYRMKADLKRALASKHNLRLVEITPRDDHRLSELLGEWMPSESAESS